MLITFSKSPDDIYTYLVFICNQKIVGLLAQRRKGKKKQKILAFEKLKKKKLRSWIFLKAKYLKVLVEYIQNFNTFVKRRRKE